MTHVAQDRPHASNGKARLDEARRLAAGQPTAQLPTRAGAPAQQLSAPLVKQSRQERIADLARDFTTELIRWRANYTAQQIVGEAFSLAREFVSEAEKAEKTDQQKTDTTAASLAEEQ